MFFFKKKTKTNYQLALAEAQACSVTFRPGDVDSDYKAGGEGVRIMLSNLGPYLPFILMKGTRDWLKKAYDLTDEEASKVYRTLVAKARKQIQVYERDRKRGSKPQSLMEMVRRW